MKAADDQAEYFFASVFALFASLRLRVFAVEFYFSDERQTARNSAAWILTRRNGALSFV